MLLVDLDMIAVDSGAAALWRVGRLGVRCAVDRLAQ